METDLIKFNNNITKVNDELSKYEDDKGFLFIMPTTSLLVSCEYKEITKQEYEQMIFSKIIPKELELEEETVKRQKVKYEITKDEKDKNTIIDTNVMIKKVWLVKNTLNLVKAFNNKDEAIELAKELNKKYL